MSRCGMTHISLHDDNRSYWQINGEPSLLVGGSDDENVFQWPEEEMLAHLDLLASVGGNYDRCTLSSRPQRGCEVYPHLKRDDGKYDLAQWNEEFWTRLERYLHACNERGIIVQLELWATYDLTARWAQDCPYNPAFNVNYASPPETILGPHYAQYKDIFDFYCAVPALKNDTSVLNYQRAFIDRVLSLTLPLGNVLYCIDNEYSFNQPWQWFRYWTEYIKRKADEAGTIVYVSEMNLVDWELRRALAAGKALSPELEERLGPGTSHVFNRNHREIFDHPEVYDYVDFSNNADTAGEENWANLRAVRAYISGKPRPINHDKIYGADFGIKWGSREGINLFWHNVCGGAASVRFHRPPTGLGLGPLAQASIRALRKFEAAIKPWDCVPYLECLAHREPNSVYAIANPGRAYGLYFTGAAPRAWVKLKTDDEPDPFTLRWLNVSTGEWGESYTFRGNKWEGNVIAVPAHGSDYGWAAVVVREADSEGKEVLADCS